MGSRIDEDDDDGGFGDIFSSFGSAPALHQYAHTQNFGGPTSVDDLLFGSQTEQLEHHRHKKRGEEEEQFHATTKLSEGFSLDDDHPTTAYSTPVKIFDRFYSSSSDDDDGEGELYPATSTSCFGGLENASSSVQSASKRLDNMIQFLERKLSSSDSISRSSDNRRDYDQSPLLPEFVASGGGTGIFRVPARAAVHPGRPPCLELRPHPLRESQIGCFLRTLLTVTTTDSSQLWAGSERGVRFWDLSQIYDAATPPSRTLPVEGDEETVPFRDSVQTPPTMCMVADGANRIVWSGHRDGRIRCWKVMMMHQHQQPLQLQDWNGGSTTPFREMFSWQAHRSPVFSIVITSCGDLWSGSEGGAIKIWPWESIEKAFSHTLEERHMAALTVERSYIDLKSQVNANGVCSNFTYDVKYLLSDHSGGKVWSAGYIMFALWDSCSRELLKVFNIDGQNENLSLSQDPLMEDEVKMKFVSGSWKERQQSASNFFQRSRNALMGAAGAVRRVAAKGAFGDDNRRTETLLATIDGMIWTGCSNGLIVQWDGSGNRLQNFQYHPLAVQCMMTFGSQIWVGYSSGIVQVLDLNGSVLGEWVAHNSAIIDMSVGGGYIFTLANHGGIRGWNLASPGPFDDILRSELAGKEFLYTRMENLKILAGTWNVGQGRASPGSLISWIGSAAADVSIIVVGLQEVEMGAGFLAMSAAKETVGLEGSSAGQWWLDMIGKTLDEGSSVERVGSRQLAGLLIGVWVRNNIRGHVGDVDAAAVPCGFGRAIGNKGAVGLRMRVYGRSMCFVNCHFAAHLEAVNRRNADFDHVYRTMIFSRPTSVLNAAAAGVSSSIQMLRGANTMGGINSGEGMPELSEADMVVFLGDFNYRLNDTSYDEARDFISQRCFDWLRERDQLQAEMKAGNVFQGMREAIIGFPPTYKFERHQPGLSGYDSGEKRRIPAWCDRILYRDSRSASVSACSLDCPVVSSITQYEACMDVTDSDHKPVRCTFSVEIARVDELIRRQEFGEIIRSNENIRSMLEELCKVPETVVSTNNILLQNQGTSILRITNKSGKQNAFFEVICEGQSMIKEDGLPSNHHPRGSFGFPRWLEVSPATGIIKPNRIIEIEVHHDKFLTQEEFVDGMPQNSWCEDARDKEVILVVKVFGSYSTETRSHRIRVRHCFLSGKCMHSENVGNSDLIQPANVLRRSDFQRLSCAFDVVDHLGNLRTP